MTPPTAAPTVEGATAVLLARCLAVLEAAGDDGIAGETGSLHLAWMCRHAAANLGSWPVDKASRWLGYVQGVMAVRGLLSVSAERDFSRPLFHAAYAAAGRGIPATTDPQAASA